MKLLSHISRVKLYQYILFSLVMTIFIVASMSLVFHGRITVDYLVTGAIASALVSAFVMSIIIGYKKAIEEQNLKLSQEEKRLSEVIYEKNEVLGIVAHDIRNHLNTILGNSSLLAEDIVDVEAPNQKEMLEMTGDISQAVSRIKKISEALVKANKLESGTIELPCKSFCLDGVFDQLSSQFDSVASKKNISLHWGLSSDIFVNVNEDATFEILENLISNAIKYSPLDKNVEIRLNSLESAVQIKVEDQGPGISPEDQDELFKKFSRVGSVPTGGEESIGLGLSIAKKLVEIMNGRIWCESAKGQGSMFVVELPKG